MPALFEEISFVNVTSAISDGLVLSRVTINSLRMYFPSLRYAEMVQDMLSAQPLIPCSLTAVKT